MNLGPIVAQAMAIDRRACIADDGAFDCGEWSSAAVWRQRDSELEALATAYGFKDYAALREVVTARTSYRWAYFNLPDMGIST